MAEDKNKQLFLSLIYSFQMQTMMQLGKLANPMSGTIDRELEGAQVTIDMLDMLKTKTKGNVNEDESKFLDQIIADLKLNYVEERDKDKSAAKNIEEPKSPVEEKEEQKDTGEKKQTESDAKEKDAKAESKNEGEKKQSSDKDFKEKPDPDKTADSDKSLPPQE
ncbi:MAG: DUF1844 domain-containing protein [Bacteroidota bacterium]|nr:DUF1844 domain-containing protein [Bacteroidota bacterium]